MIKIEKSTILTQHKPQKLNNFKNVIHSLINLFEYKNKVSTLIIFKKNSNREKTKTVN